MLMTHKRSDGFIEILFIKSISYPLIFKKMSCTVNLLNIKDAYSEGVFFVKKFFGQQISVSTSETIPVKVHPVTKSFTNSEKHLRNLKKRKTIQQ